MRQVTDIEVKKRFHFDNPWWDIEETYSTGYEHKRAYFDGLFSLLSKEDVNRAVVLMGPRRVGKTVLLKQIIEELVNNKGIVGTKILYLSLDIPLYSGLPLENLLNYYLEEIGHENTNGLFVFYDEIQYFPNWEVHLKTLVDSYPSIQFCVSGSAAAALKLKSDESGAGRFTDFLLPPLSFYEFCQFQKFELPEALFENFSLHEDDYIKSLNAHFVNYIHYGGFPEALFSESIRENFARYIGQDVVDKVLLRDLPTLFGISDPQELNRFFTMIAYNSGEEVSIEKLSKNSGVAKNTLKKYLDFLEAAFLIKIIKRVDDNLKQFKRTTHFKVYLTNPSMRTALFGPVNPDEDIFGKLVETAVFAQHMHSREIVNIYYARWKGGKGEIDLVETNPSTHKPKRLVEIKWSDRIINTTSEMKSLISVAQRTLSKHAEPYPILMLTKSEFTIKTISGVEVMFQPAAEYCYKIGIISIILPLSIGIHPSSDTLVDPDILENSKKKEINIYIPEQVLKFSQLQAIRLKPYK